MGFAATLDDLSFPEILHLISFHKKSGRLTLTCPEGHALVVFREGRIVYAASNRLRESFGYILLRSGALTEQDLAEALERQNRLEHDRRLGRQLVQTGAVAASDAHKALRQQAQWVITEVFQWRTGFFKFEPPNAASPGADDADDDVALTDEGFDTEELLLEAVAVLDEGYEHDEWKGDATNKPSWTGDAFRVPPEWEGAGRSASWTSLLHEIRSPSFAGEIVLTLLRYAAQVVSRGVFLLVSNHELMSVGQFGIEDAGPAPRRIWLPLNEPSAFLDAVQRKRSFRGALPHQFWNDHFLEQLGGARPREAVLVPMILEGRAAYVFYGDNLPGAAPIGPIQGLEFLMTEAAQAMEKLLLPTAGHRRAFRRSDS
jgi:hypothetical protein